MQSCRSERVTVTEGRPAVASKLAEWAESGQTLALIIPGGVAPMDYFGHLAGANESFVFRGHGVSISLGLHKFEHVRLEEEGPFSSVCLRRGGSVNDDIAICSGPLIQDLQG